MSLDKNQLKTDAKSLLQNSKPSPVLIGLLFVSVTLLLDYLSANLLSGNISDSAAQKYYNMIQNGKLDAAIEYAQSFMPSATSTVINMAISIIRIVLSAGFAIFMLNTVRKTGTACAGNLLDGFGIFGRVFCLNLLKGILVILGSLLFIVPGIILAYAYRQSMYLLIDHPEYGAVKCLKESRRLMKGHKWELFGLDLSFFWWFLLEAVASPVAVWVRPYTNATWALYYQALCSRQNMYNAFDI